MKILYISQYIYPYTICGVGIHIQEMARNIRAIESSTEIVVIGNVDHQDKKIEQIVEGIKIRGYSPLIKHIRIPKVGTLLDGGLSFKPFFMMKEENPDIVHFHSYAGSWLGLLGLIYCKVFKKKMFFTPHYHDIRLYRFHPLFYINKLIAKSCDMVIVVTKTEKEKMMRLFNIPGSKIEVIYNGLSEDILDQNCKREKFILYVGRGIEERKGVGRSLKLFLDLRREGILNDEWKFVAAGDGVNSDKYQEMVNKEYEKDVCLMGLVSRKKLIDLYRTCYMLILPSDYEAFGIVLIEAMACRKPVVAFNVGGVSEAIINNKTGYAVCDMKEMKAKVKDLVSNERLAVKMGEAGYEHVKDKFLWSKSAKKQYQCYEKVLGR